MRNIHLSALAIAVTISGCSMVKSTNLGGAVQPPMTANLTYSLPRLLVEAQVFEARGGGHIIRFDDPRLTRDPLHTYALSYTPSPLSDDTLTLNADAETGFLTGLDGKAVDQTVAIAKEAAKLASSFTLSDKTTDETIPILTLIFDPHTELEAQNTLLASNGVRLAFRCDECAPPAPSAPEANGFYTRPSTSVRLFVVDTISNTPISGTILKSPNGSRLVAMPLNRSLAVTRTTQYQEFANGVPTKVVQGKPSELLGLVTGIGEIAGEIVAAPIRAATDGVARADAITSQTDAETKLIEAEIKRTEALTKLSEAETSRLAAEASAQTPAQENDNSTNADAEGDG